MRTLLEHRDTQRYLKEADLSPQLLALLNSSIVELDGCFLLAALTAADFTADSALAASHDRTDLETSVNHVHIEMMLERTNTWTHSHVLAQGIKYAERLYEKLRQVGLDFRVVLAYYEQDASDFDCSVRFYRLRPDEAEYLSDDLEDYRDEAIMVWDT